MIECVHGYWLLLWYMASFSRYSHRNCIINYKWGCQLCRMECPDEYLGRLNFPPLQRGKTWEYSQLTACWIKMFFCVFSNCLSWRCIDFLASIYFYLQRFFTNSRICADVTGPDKYLLSANYFIIVCGKRFFFIFFYIYIFRFISFPAVILEMNLSDT